MKLHQETFSTYTYIYKKGVKGRKAIISNFTYILRPEWQSNQIINPLQIKINHYMTNYKLTIAIYDDKNKKMRRHIFQNRKYTDTRLFELMQRAFKKKVRGNKLLREHLKNVYDFIAENYESLITPQEDYVENFGV